MPRAVPLEHRNTLEGVLAGVGAVVEGRKKMMRMLAAMAMAGMAAAGVSGDRSLVVAEPRLVNWDRRSGESWQLRCVLA